jgi:DNA-binding SARP family transcriptional activator/TolB-like protein
VSKALRVNTFGGLWIESPEGGSAADLRPRGLALLAILAAGGAKGMTRDRVLGVLWPDTDEERARHALSQTIYGLRRDLGEDVIDSTPALRLDPSHISSDVADFQAAVKAREWEKAAAQYHGPFLDGFYLADAPEFERWVENERASLATAGIRAIEIVAKASAEAGRPEEAAEHWHRLTRLDPLDSRIAASYMEALAALGDRAAAIAHGRAHAELRRRELEVGPDPVVERVVERLREATDLPAGGRVPRSTLPPAGRDREAAAPPAAPPPLLSAAALSASGEVASERSDAPVQPTAAPVIPGPPEALPVPYRRLALGRRTIVIGASVAAVVIAGVLVWRATGASREASRPVLAVGRIRDLALPDSAALGVLSSEMLATSLGRLDEVQVIANSRMLELTPRDADTSRTAFTDAARRAGATEVIEGELVPLADRRFRLEIRRVDIARGLVRGGYRATGSERIALVDSVTAKIAADLRVGAPSGSLADVSTRSPVAYRFYEEGLRALYQYDAYAANGLFRSAVREDSTFPMATYYAWRTARAVGEADEGLLADRAVALAERASPRDRLLILTHVGAERSDLRALAAAETLATEYPRDPEALVRATEVMTDLGRAIQLLDRAIAIDSAASPRSLAFCRVCEALSQLNTRYEWADSAAAVERTLQRWRTLRPNDATPWALLADWLIGFGRREEAETARRRYESLGGTRAGQLGNLVRSLRLDDLDAADRACNAGLASAERDEFTRYRWYCVIALRMEGRYREALALARNGRVPQSRIVRHGFTPDAYELAILQMEMGQPLAAGNLFHDMAKAEATRGPEGTRARNMAWLLTLSATAAVAAGDTARGRRLADSIEAIGKRSLFARDPLLHHFVRGLLYARAQQPDAAVRELRSAMHSPTFGFTRINYELGEQLLALGRPKEAINVVQGALHGGLEGSGLYVTRTEMHDLLARLFDASGQRDSAAAHFTVVERAWRMADPFLAPRAEAARQWLMREGRHTTFGRSSTPTVDAMIRRRQDVAAHRRPGRSHWVSDLPSHSPVLLLGDDHVLDVALPQQRLVRLQVAAHHLFELHPDLTDAFAQQLLDFAVLRRRRVIRAAC